MPPTPSGSRSVTSVWWRLTLAAVAAATTVDALLLQQKWNYFTGGFLAVDHASTWPDVLRFIVGSAAADAAVLAPVLAAFVWAGRRIVARPSGALLAFALGLAPIAIGDVIMYELESYFGAGFDVTLMFELTSRRVSELLAVSMVNRRAMALTAAVTGATGVLLWRFVRSARRRPRLPVVARGGPLARAAVGVTLCGLGLSTWLRLPGDVVDGGLRRKPSARILEIAVNRLADVDRDGFGPIGRAADPDLFDARVFPWAVDVPGNGIDENGVGGDHPAAAAPYVESSPERRQWTHRPDVVFVVLESVRADVVGSTRDGVAVTPMLDALAARGRRVAHAFSHNGFTVQSRWHMLTGALAGVRRPPSLLDDFAAQGYQTAFFSGQDESFGGPDFDVGFRHAETAYDARSDSDKRVSFFATPGSLAVSGDLVLERVRAFLKTRRPDRPLFLYVNFHDTHYPYSHATLPQLLPAPGFDAGHISPAAPAALRAGYENAVAYVDRLVGDVLAAVTDTRGVAPAVVAVSDHGESLFDDGFLGHGFELNEQQTRIPLVVSGLPVRIVEPLGQADLRDVVLDAMAALGGPGVAEVRSDPARRVFQYLGSIDRPGQIALRGLSDVILYDLRTRLVRVDGGPWVVQAALSGPDRVRFQTLVETWEAIVLARASARDATPTVSSAR